MMITLRTHSPGLLAIGVAALLAGCATTQMNAEWRDPAFAAGSLKGGRVLVVVDPHPTGPRISIVGERLDVRTFDVLPGGDVPRTSDAASGGRAG